MEEKKEKTRQILLLIAIFIFIILLVFMIVYLVKNAELMKADAINYAIDKYNYSYCYCMDGKGNILNFGKN